jgi:hypothetical protein
MEYDFAIVYFGVVRAVSKTHESHKKFLFDVLDQNNLRYRIFMHTWKLKDDLMNIGHITLPSTINYSEYSLLHPDIYRIDDEEEFLKTVPMNEYFYEDVWKLRGDHPKGEWIPKLLSNYICMLESQKRGIRMMKETTKEGCSYKRVIFMRPDVMLEKPFPLQTVLENIDAIYVPNHSHYEGYNDQGAVMSYAHTSIYEKRLDELAEFRKKYGRIVAEKYCKFFFQHHNLKVILFDFKFCITRP